MKFFKLFNDWDGMSLNENITKFATKLINLSDGALDGGSSYRFKNVAGWSHPEMEEFLKTHYDNVIPLKIGNGPKETHSESSIYPGWFVTDKETGETKKVLLADASRGASKHEDPVIQNINDYFETRKILIKELVKRGEEITRWNMQNLADTWRSEEGIEAVMERIIGDLDLNENHIIDSLRNAGEAVFLRKKLGDKFVLIAVDAPQRLRFERTLKRGKEGDPKTWEEFLKVDERDNHKIRTTSDP